MLHCTTASTLLDLYHGWQSTAPKRAAVSPLVPETLIVPNYLVGHWLSQQEAKHAGIVANRRYLLPSQWLWECLQQCLGQTVSADNSAFEGHALALRIFTALMDDEWIEPFARLKAYRDHAVTNARLSDVLTLATKIAELFDRYQHYRTDWLDAWQADPSIVALNHEDEPWQAALWRYLNHGSDNHNPDSVPRYQQLQQLLKLLKQSPEYQQKLPNSMTLFGVPQLSPLVLEALESLSEWMDIHVYGLQLTSAELPHWQLGQGILPALNGSALASAVRPHSALGQLQACLFEGASLQARPMRNHDHSLCVVSAHSAMREVEAVYDFIANRLHSETWQPSDITIGIADFETYAPCIRAVFGASDAIPYQLCDALVVQESLLLQGLQTLLTLPRWRFTREEVMSLLNNRLILRKIDLEKSDMETIEQWLDNTRVHWGIDGEHKQSLGLPASDQHSWRQGLDRILLGFAVAPLSEAGLPILVNDYAPMDDLESADALRFSRFVGYCDALIEWRSVLLTPCTLHEWIGRLRDLVAVFFNVDEREVAAQSVLLEHLGALQSAAEQTAREHDLDANAMALLLQEGLSQASVGTRLSGAVNIAKISTLAGLPFKQVCLLGLNLDTWPAKETPLGFDIMAHKHHARPYDRNRAQEDRHTTLLWLACAQTGLYLSYQGQRLDKLQARPPSVLVSELRHFCQQHRIHIVDKQYGMHPFSAANFSKDAGPLQSHSAIWCEAAQQAGQGLESAQPLSSPAEYNTPIGKDSCPDAIEVDDLLRFYRNPPLAFLRRLGVYPEGDQAAYDNTEPFALANFTDQRLREQLLHEYPPTQNDAFDHDHDQVLARAAASGILPQGEVGVQLFNQEVATISQLHRTVAELWEAVTPQAVPIQMDVNLDQQPVFISGLLNINRHPTQGAMVLSAGKLYDHQRIAYWLRHLLINAAETTPNHQGINTCIFTSAHPDAPTIYPGMPAAEAKQQLTQWVRGYVLGQEKPLPFHPKLSLKYWDTQFEPKKDPLQEAQNVWDGGYNREGLKAKPEMKYVYRDSSPVDPSNEAMFSAFREWTEQLLTGMGSSQ